MHPPPSRLKLLSAFAAVYIVWGSTYLAIRIAIETIPPFLMASLRFFVAGGMLYFWARFRSAERPTSAHWKSTAIIGLMLLMVGNGGLSWSEKLIPSGIAALIVAVTPLWFVLLEWLERGKRPTAGVALGLILGTLGIAFLIDPANLVGGVKIDTLAAAVLLGSSICWAFGSMYSRRAVLPSSPPLANGMEMIFGAIGLLVLSALTGEFNSLHLSAVTGRSLLAVGYLVVFGSIIGFSSYVWLFRATTPSRASTYAYVNPVVAVFIGWLFAGEPLQGRVLAAGALIVAAVAAITVLGTRKSSRQMKELANEEGKAVHE